MTRAEYAYTTGELGEAVDTVNYTYGDDDWGDLLTAYDGVAISYDKIGNPTSYYNGTRWTFGWEQGRRLATATDGTTNLSFAYDADGIRTTKTVDGVKHTYYYAGGKLLREVYGNNTLDFFYDASGNAYAVKYNGTVYYYITNLQGDVMQIVNADGAAVATYSYDSYGNVLTATGDLAEVNPLRYRGYYYDHETGLYYLQSRYYDPEIGRFINADAFASTGQGILGNNMFAYCGNNPVIRVDYNGQFSVQAWWQDFLEDLREWLQEKKEEAAADENKTTTVGGTASGAFGIGASVALGITTDTKGNVGIAFTFNGGGGFPSVGVGGFVSRNNAPTIYHQEGWGTVVGASGGPGVVAVGGEYNILIDKDNGCSYHGGTFSLTYGLYPTIVEVHGEAGYTWVKGFNIYVKAIEIVDLLIGDQGG